MITLGLTGSIGMGKTTTAGLLREAGVPVHDADAAVHDLYAVGGAGAPALLVDFPEAVIDGRVDRERLSARVVGDPAALQRLEAIVHPLVWAHRQAFIDEAVRQGAPAIAFDVPLLFETGAHADLDAIIVVTAPQAVQKERVMARPGMTEAKLDAILARQTPDADKRARADFVVDTSRGVEAARAQVLQILGTVTAPGWRRGQPSS